jgi:hypothetical protein
MSAFSVMSLSAHLFVTYYFQMSSYLLNLLAHFAIARAKENIERL